MPPPKLHGSPFAVVIIMVGKLVRNVLRLWNEWVSLFRVFVRTLRWTYAEWQVRRLAVDDFTKARP